MENSKDKRNKVSDILDFLQTDIWRIRSSKLSRQKSFWIRQLRIFLLAIRGFAEDKCQLRASALTFYSLLSVVPVIAMAFGVAKGFGLERVLEERVLKSFEGQEEVGTKIIGFATAFLEKTQGGVIAGIGVIVLFWTVIKVLGNIESSFNDIWGIKKARTIGRKFSDYLSIMLICPFLLIMAGSVTAVITSQAELLLNKLSFLGPIVPIVMTILNFLPYAVLWVLFTFMYIFMPNTKVNFKSGLIAGIVAGSIYQIIQYLFMKFQIGVSNFGAIYGSFAALPLFLIWLQISWLVVLFGAEMSFAEQNVETYEFEPDCLKASHSFKRMMALNIAQISVKNFEEGNNPLNADEFAHKLEIPVRLCRELLFRLSEANILNEVKINNGKEISTYQPARSTEKLTIAYVVEAMDNLGIDNIPVAESKEAELINKSLNKFRDVVNKSSENVLLRDI